MSVVMLSILPQFGFSQEDFRIIAVNEAARTMEKSLFASADPAVVNQYIPNGAPASMSSMVLFAGADTVLFDTGLGGEAWFKQIKALGIKADTVKLILLTHLHPDHIGGLFDDNARRFPNAAVRCALPEYVGTGAAQNKIKAVYGAAFENPFGYGETVFNNGTVKIKALDAAGHTPGHTAFLIESAKKKCLVAGDLLHAAALQFPKPEICSSYDSDPAAAVASRKRILNLAAEGNIPIGGMHFPAPNFGTVQKDGSGGYIFHLDKVKSE
ncbi:MAG: MBL fold metallo-hydrolase [Planctomycetaceae bacterium]|nr:MBL fold metallo-hydrolase [Planctomycetaceae bacterium]